MPRVQVLSAQVANQIAAGEVIERPASVVKELVENSIDAGATSVEVEFKSGGKSFIRIEDNGCGMGREDALLSLERHATSKMRKADDLESILTMGFRGEALPSIASVSKFLLQTREQGSDVGTEILVDGGRMDKVRECGMPAGTRMTISNLFNTVPARRKFLKTVTTESAHIVHNTRLYALAHPDVAFTLIDDGRTLFKTPVCKCLEDRVGEIYGKSLVSKLMPIDGCEGDMRLSGLIGKPGQSKTSRHEMLLFVNGRPVENRTLAYALIESYHGHIPKGRYPIAFLFMEIPPRLLDINVHPAKREIRFRNETQVRGFAVRTILEALNESAKTALPRFDGPRLPKESSFAEAVEVSPTECRKEDSNAAPESQTTKRRLVKKGAVENEEVPQGEAVEAAADLTIVEREEPSGVEPSDPAIRSIPVDWQFIGWSRKDLALYDTDAGLVLFDAKAAQRRVWYERLQRQFSSNSSESQKLLLAVPVEFDPVSAALLEDQIDLIRSYGFDIEQFGRNFYRIESVPTWLKENEAEIFLREIVEMLRLGKLPKDNVAHARDRVARFAALKTVRLERNLSESMLTGLLEELFACSNPLGDPDGRPTFIELTRAELNRRFQRKANEVDQDLL